MMPPALLRSHRPLHRVGLCRCAAVLVCALLAGSEARAQEPSRPDGLRLNDVQVVGSHNSYKQAIDPALLELMRARSPRQADALDYAHPPLAEQLDGGLRSLELDVYHDPEGGRYAAPLGLALAAASTHDPEGVMAAPGFKVLHVQDLDFRSVCLRLDACLAAIRTWSEANPRHLPIVVTMNAKDSPLDLPDATVPLPFDAAAFDALDAAIREAFPPGALITPDDVRGDFPTLEAAVLAGGWPSLDASRGRVLFVLDEGGDKLAIYRDGHPSLRGRALFANAPEGTPEAAVRIVNDPVGDFDYIQELVRTGYLVRTRADADTREARSGDTRRREAAFASGAHVVTTDYHAPDARFGTDYVVRLPGGGVGRCNPVREPAACPAGGLE